MSKKKELEYNDVYKKTLEYFNGDELATSVWIGKYSAVGEMSPDDMHVRLAKEFNRIESKYILEESLIPLSKDKLSDYGKSRGDLNEEGIFELFKDFKYIVPQGRVMAGLGVGESYRSLSNCLRLPSPKDNYSSIMYTDTMLVSSAKRGCGYGLGISNLRPKDTHVTNAAKTSTGAVSFMERFSNSTREVGQNSRRGACLLDIDINHPDVMEFVKVKQDLTKVTGANISVFLNDEFMKAVESNSDYILRYPVDKNVDGVDTNIEYDKLISITFDDNTNGFIKKIKAKDYFSEIVLAAKKHAEPGCFFRNRFNSFSPSNVYSKYFEEGTNACISGDYMVLTTSGYKQLKEITEKDVISTSYGKENITSIEVNKEYDIWKVKFSDGGELEVTENHIFYGKTKYSDRFDNSELKLKDLKIGDLIKVQKSFNILENNYDNYDKFFNVQLNGFDIKQLKTTGDFIGFLDNVFISHGSVERDVTSEPKLTWKTSDYGLAQIIRLSLLAIGCHGKLVYTEKDDIYTVNISFESIQTYVNLTRLNEKNVKLYTEMLNLLRHYSLNGDTWYASVVSIEKCGKKDVYDIYCEKSDTWSVSGYLNRGCGEQPMAVYDTCRLILINLFSVVDNPFTPEAKINYELLYKISYEQLRMGDDLVDLEIEYLTRIIEKIKSDDEPIEEKQIELTLWENVRDMAKSGRRVGCGITALGDMIAALNIKYDSQEALEIVDSVMKTKMKAELDCTTDLAILRGTFTDWSFDKEYTIEKGVLKGKNEWYEFIKDEFKEQTSRMNKYGRRNVNYNTIAPCGTVSIETQTTSGCEPLFMAYYMRNKKINPSDKNVRIDFTDQNGDNWMEFPVLHQKFKYWYNTLEESKTKEIESLTRAELDAVYKKSPYYKATANDIDWNKRIQIQSILQKYTTSAISSTLNLPANTTKDEVYNIYMEAWKQGLKGVTIYVDGSRTGVMVSVDKKIEEKMSHGSTKRPKSIPCKVVKFNNEGEKWVSVVGLVNGKPYEIFTGLLDRLNIPSYVEDGFIVKTKETISEKDELGTITEKSVGRYDLQYKSKETGEIVTISGLSNTFREEFWNYAKLISGLLRHNMPIEYVVKVISDLNLGNGNINSWKVGVIRTLKKFIKDGTHVGEPCPECGENMTRKDGCIICTSCGYSKCG